MFNLTGNNTSGGYANPQVAAPGEYETGLAQRNFLGAQTSNLAGQLPFQRQQLQQQGALQRQGYTTQLAQSRMQQLPAQLQQKRFNSVFPFVKGAFGQLGNQGTFNSSVGGQSGQGPHVGTGPVWDAGTLQAQINNQRAHTDQQTAGQIHAMNQQLAGQGYGDDSPLAALLTATYQGQGNATNADTATGLRWQAGQGNAQQQLASQTAQEQQFAQRQSEDIERRRVNQQQYATQQSALAQRLSALTQLV